MYTISVIAIPKAYLNNSIRFNSLNYILTRITQAGQFDLLGAHFDPAINLKALPFVLFPAL